jgi:hypothetical protein
MKAPTKYYYYHKNDPKKEPIGKIEADNLEEALLKAAHIKQLKIDNFLDVFKVERYGKQST